MVIDSILNSDFYMNMHPLFEKAFDWLKSNDLKALENGKYPLDGDNLIANVMAYECKNATDAKIESHKNYIDIQYLVSGEEMMGYALLDGQEVVEDNEAKDCIFYQAPVSMVRVKSGMFAIFMPQDLHQPNVVSEPGTKNKKVVVKVKVQP